jgi:hypothetical protein
MSDCLTHLQNQFQEWMDYLGVAVPTSNSSFYAIAGLAGFAVAAHLFLNSIPQQSDMSMLSNIDYTNVSIPTDDGRISALCLDGKEFVVGYFCRSFQILLVKSMFGCFPTKLKNY